MVMFNSYVTNYQRVIYFKWCYRHGTTHLSRSLFSSISTNHMDPYGLMVGIQDIIL